MSYQAIINNEDHGMVSELDLSDVEITDVNGKTISIRLDNMNLEVECMEVNMSERKFLLRIDGITHHLELLDEVDQMVHTLGMEVEAAGASGDVEAPMPGKVLAIKVEEGQEVQEGDPLIILEAMKMENILKAQGPGHVESVHAEVGQTVEKGSLLISMS